MTDSPETKARQNAAFGFKALLVVAAAGMIWVALLSEGSPVAGPFRELPLPTVQEIPEHHHWAARREIQEEKMWTALDQLDWIREEARKIGAPLTLSDAEYDRLRRRVQNSMATRP